MKFIVLILLALGPLVAQIDNKYEDSIAVGWNRFANEANQWIQLKKNVVAAQGRDKKEKAQWELVKARWQELVKVVDSK